MKTAATIGIIIIALSTLAPAARASVPDLIPVQGVLTTSGGQVVDGQAQVRFALYSAQTGSDALWTESYEGTNQLIVDHGLFTAYLGTLTPLYFEDFIAVETLWLGVAVGSDEELGRVRLAAVPFAQEAQLCHQLGDFEADEIQPRLSLDGDVDVGTCGSGEVVQGIDPQTGAIKCTPDTFDPASIVLESVDAIAPISASTSASDDVTLSISVGPGAGEVAAGDHTHDGDFLPQVTCTSGNTIKYTASGWACGADNDTNTTYSAGSGLTLSGTQLSANIAGAGNATTGARSDHNHDGTYLPALTCTVGYVLKHTGTAWACGVDSDANTTYTAGSGLTLSSTQFNVGFGGTGSAASSARSDHAHDGVYLPGPVCPSGYLLRQSGSSWSCAADIDSNTTYTAGTGLTLTGTALSANTSAVQSRVSSSCAEGTAIRSIASNGTVTCQQVLPPIPTIFKGLNYGAATATVNWTQIAIGTRTFSKSYGSASTKVKLTLNSRLSSGTFSGATAVQFQLRVDGDMPDEAQDYWIHSSSTSIRSIFSNYFTGLAAGNHTVTLWARTNTGSSTTVTADPGGWNGSILVKEY